MTAVHRVTVPGFLATTDGLVAVYVDLLFARSNPLEIGVHVRHADTQATGRPWPVMRTGLIEALKGGTDPVGTRDLYAVVATLRGHWMVQISALTDAGRRVVLVPADRVHQFVADTVHLVPLGAERRALARGILSHESLEAVVSGWAAGICCPRCGGVRRGLPASCGDPVCVAEDWRATLELEQRIEATNED